MTVIELRRDGRVDINGVDIDLVTYLSFLALSLKLKQMHDIR